MWRKYISHMCHVGLKGFASKKLPRGPEEVHDPTGPTMAGLCATLGMYNVEAFRLNFDNEGWKKFWLRNAKRRLNEELKLSILLLASWFANGKIVIKEEFAQNSSAFYFIFILFFCLLLWKQMIVSYTVIFEFYGGTNTTRGYWLKICIFV